MKEPRITCCSLLMRLKLKYLLLMIFCVVFHLLIFLLLRMCLSFAFKTLHENGVNPKIGFIPKLNRGNVIYSHMDWHDYDFLEYEAGRKGLGERGVAAYTPVGTEKEVARQRAIYGYNAYLSDLIALNRSVADLRPPECRVKVYSATLPAVAVIIVFNNEHYKTLIRTWASIVNRTPSRLLQEIILVDDSSDFKELGKPLDEFVEANGSIVKLIRSKKRIGLIRARLIGARAAKSEILVFMDAHCEVNTNWLPPLLDPILNNYRRVMCPMIDSIHHATFAYTVQDEGARGAFDWHFDYKRLPLLPSDLNDTTEPFKSPIMAGGLFAISAKFFWELGGYDEGLDIWGGEQYELSFKIWMCGGEMYDAPCSRIGHIYRSGGNPHPFVKDYHLRRNYKRVAEVWMDEYKHYLYEQNSKAYASINVGNLSKALAVRRKLQCKSFDWFIREVAFDLIKDFPPRETYEYAWGSVQSQSELTLCVDSKNRQEKQALELSHCGQNIKRPKEINLFFHLTWRSEIRVHMGNLCWDVPSDAKNAAVELYQCHRGRGHQLWRLDLEKNWIIHESPTTRCLEFDNESLKLIVNECDEKNMRMLWSFGDMNKAKIATLS